MEVYGATLVTGHIQLIRLAFNVDHTPEVGAVFQSGPGQNGAGAYGHVGVVESINSNGSVTVSEMNWNGGVNVKSYRTISNPNSYNYIH